MRACGAQYCRVARASWPPPPAVNLLASCPMIAFGCPITDGGLYERYARRGIELVAESDSAVLAHQSGGSIFRAYTLLMDLAAKNDTLESLVLLHHDFETTVPDFSRKV